MTRGQILVLTAAVLVGLGLLGAFAWQIFASQPPILPVFSGKTPLPDPTRGDTGASTPILQKPSATAIQKVTPSLSPVSSPSPAVSPHDPLPDPRGCLPGEEGESVDLLEVLADGSLRVFYGRREALVRLLGVEPAGDLTAAAAALHELTAGRRLLLVREDADTDSAGRWLRYVLADETFVNYELVRLGAALPELFPPGLACEETFLAAERQARAEGRGYWAGLASMPSAQLPGPNAATLQAPPCDCTRAYECADFTTRKTAQACFDACGDYRNVSLDTDGNGLACEQLP